MLHLDGPRARAMAQNNPRGHPSLPCAQPGVLVVALDVGAPLWMVESLLSQKASLAPYLPQPAHSPHAKEETLLYLRHWGFIQPCGRHNLLGNLALGRVEGQSGAGQRPMGMAVSPSDSPACRGLEGMGQSRLGPNTRLGGSECVAFHHGVLLVYIYFKTVVKYT